MLYDHIFLVAKQMYFISQFSSGLPTADNKRVGKMCEDHNEGARVGEGGGSLSVKIFEIYGCIWCILGLVFFN